MAGGTVAISDTGPLISAFQSDSFSLLTNVFGSIHIPAGCSEELGQHGWQDEIQAAADKLVTLQLTVNEARKARSLARLIAEQGGSPVASASSHMGEAQAIALALRPVYRDDLPLLDEQAARVIAHDQGLRLSGFPGVLLLAVQGGLISAADLKDRLERCREQGSHYGKRLIEQVYDMARGA